MTVRVASTEGFDRVSLLRTALSWYAALQAKPPAKHPVSGVDGLTVHEGAAAFDGLNATGATDCKRLRRYAPGTKRAMEPDVLDAAGEGFVSDAAGD